MVWHVRGSPCMAAYTLTRQVHRALCIVLTVQRTCARDAERLPAVRGNQRLRVRPRVFVVFIETNVPLIGACVRLHDTSPSR